MKQAIGIQVTFILKNKFRKDRLLFLQNVTVSLGIYASILKHGNVHTYATISDYEKKVFTTNIQNIKQAVGI